MDNRSKRIVKNTMFLYSRTLIMMVVGLYTSRVVINSLGLSDYGIYNIVGGVVGLFGFINSSMTRSTQRFLNFEIGKPSEESINKIFSNSIFIHAIIALLILILSETFGLWLLNTKLVIPASQMAAAQIVYQCAVVSTVLMIIGVPYNAVVVAYEKMNIFAYLSMLDVLLKLGAAVSLSFLAANRLSIYAAMLLAIQVISFLIYYRYCRYKFPNIKLIFKFNLDIFKKMFSFTSWTMIGELAYIGLTQGVNILLNIFFGPIINASRAVSVQVQNAVKQFAGGFQTAMNPQIVKSYASGDRQYFTRIVFEGSRISFFLVFILSVPFFLETELILKLWIKLVPEYCSAFVRLILSISILDALITPLIIAASASGNIRNYQLVLGSMLLTVVPISYVCLKLGCNPTTVYWVYLIITIINVFIRLYFAKKLNGIDFYKFFKNVILKSFLAVGPLFLLFWASHYLFLDKVSDLPRLAITLGYMVVLTLAFGYWGLNKTERDLILSKISSFRKKFLSR